MRLLFFKHSLAWPRSSGHDVHTYYMMKACAELGHDVALATVIKPEDAAVTGVNLAAQITLDAARAAVDRQPIPATRLQRRFRSYWGMPDAQLLAFRAAVRTFEPDAVIVVGLDPLPYLTAVSGVRRVWYAADEWTLHHLSQVRFGSPTLREDLQMALVKGLYERAHRGVVDRVWVVSENDRRAIRLVAGMKHVDVLPNGVDGQFFTPGTEQPDERTAVFWGRLDFGPNAQALDWFCRHVWPLIRRAVPDARFTIIGFQPTPAVRALSVIDGVSLEADLPDLRAAVRRRSVVVLPFVSGAGIKNKLLEAAALGKPIVCTPKTAGGLRGNPPLVSARSADEFAEAVVSLWKDPDRCRQIGEAARAWVLENHTWGAVAREAMAGLQATPVPKAESRETKT